MSPSSFYGEPGLGLGKGWLQASFNGTPLRLTCGSDLHGYNIAYTTSGKLNSSRSNAILICHALTGDQFVASPNPLTKKNGWWDVLVGEGKVIDTGKYHVICSNILGGCSGSTGPLSNNPDTGRPWGGDFPMVTISDMVRAQVNLLSHLGIERLMAVVGGSLGGMQALEWLSRHSHRTGSAAIIASSYRNSPQNIGFNAVGRAAIFADPDWRGGRYAEYGTAPGKGLSLARMLAFFTYLTDEKMHDKFGRRLQDAHEVGFKFEPDFAVESYLEHQGKSFVKRFDANSYCHITKAMDYFDLEADHGGYLARAFEKAERIPVYTASFSSDWLFPPSETAQLVQAMREAGLDPGHETFETIHGHDAFLLDEPAFHANLKTFLDTQAERAGI